MIPFRKKLEMSLAIVAKQEFRFTALLLRRAQKARFDELDCIGARIGCVVNGGFSVPPFLLLLDRLPSSTFDGWQ
jgi:hypothetical protein